jgi:DNA-binding response OmpR family regulator
MMALYKNSPTDLHTVLIISKDVEMISVWETLFQQKNCNVIHESTPQAALDSATAMSPSLIVLDLDLPQPVRVELCRKLRVTTSGTMLLLAPSNENQHLFDYIHAGVDEYISTPISPMALLIKSMAWLVRQSWSVPV